MERKTCTEDDLRLKRARGGRRKLWVGALIVAAVVVYLILSSLGGATAYYLTVSELKAQGAASGGKAVRVSGVVREESITYDPQNSLLTFELVDATGTLPVIYKGARPDMFQGGAEAVVEGRYEADGQFRATNLLLKCPSKYEDAATVQAGGQ